jgi:hypothetical protein
MKLGVRRGVGDGAPISSNPPAHRQRAVRAAMTVMLALVAGACISEHDLDKPPPGWVAPDPPHLVVRRTKDRNKTVVHEWTVLAQAGREDVRQGHDKTWYSSGAKEWEREYDHGIPIGTWHKWHENGQPASETTFAGAEVEVPMRFWHANGQVTAEGLAKNGVRCGTWKFWNADGTLREEGEYASSLREGDWKVWSDGKPEARVAHYERGVITKAQ